jgi:hypothetical protein
MAADTGEYRTLWPLTQAFLQNPHCVRLAWSAQLSLVGNGAAMSIFQVTGAQMLL